MDVQTAFERYDEFLFVDVREPYEWEAGHVPGSVHIPLVELPHRFSELDKNRTVVAVCQVGQRSDLAARFLIEQGFDAHNLEGGVAEWAGRGFPLVGAAGLTGQVLDGYARDFNGLL